MISPRLRPFAAFALLLLAAIVPAQTLRIATWNISLYTSGRVADIQTVLFATGPVGQMNPDVLIAQEIQSPSAASAFLSALNGSQPGTWAVTFGSLTGTSSTSDSAVFYKPARVNLVGSPVKVAPAGGTSGQPRDTWRFDFHIVGDADASEIVAVYDVHMKSGSTSDDVNRRQIEAQHIRNDSSSLPANYRFLVAGDMNMQSSSQAPYQTFTSAGPGRFNDPISTPGNWNNTSTFRFVHTQDPSANGGMDDRHDQILLSTNLVDGAGTDYVGLFGVPYSTTDWNDPNHSYRCWGNDGTSFNNLLTVTGNQMVGATIAQAIKNAATTSGGHCPVFLDLHYAASHPVSGNVTLQNFGGTIPGTSLTVQIFPVGSSTPVDTQTVTLGAGGSFSLTTSVAPGNYDIAVKASHWLRRRLANVTITTTGASGLSYSLINGDVNGDNAITLGDFAALRAAFGSSSGDPNWNPEADLNGDGAVTLGDFAIQRANFGAQGD